MDYNTLSEKAAYLMGLIKGKQIDDEITLAMADLLSAIAAEADAQGEQLDDLEDDLFELSDVVSDIEEDIYGDEDDDLDDYDDDDDEDLYEVTCPQCGEVIYVDEGSFDNGDIVCPACGEVLSLLVDESETEE